MKAPCLVVLTVIGFVWLCLFLAGCTHIQHGAFRLTSVGGDLTGLRVNASGKDSLEIASMNNSNAFKETTDMIQNVAMTVGAAYSVGKMAEAAAGEQATDQAALRQSGATERAGIRAGTDAAAIKAGAPLNPR